VSSWWETSTDHSGPAGLPHLPPTLTSFYYIQYAFVRPIRNRVAVEDSQLEHPGPENLEVVGLKKFVHATAPEVDLAALIDRRLEELCRKLTVSSGGPDRLPLQLIVSSVCVKPSSGSTYTAGFVNGW
jgi:hypothetical protein